MTDRRSTAPASHRSTTRPHGGSHARSLSVRTSRGPRIAAVLSAVALLLGLVGAGTGAASASIDAGRSFTVRQAVPSVRVTVVHRVARVASARVGVRGRGVRPTGSGHMVVTVRVVVTSTARASATLSDGVVTSTEVRSTRVTRSAVRSIVIARSHNAATRAASRASWIAARALADEAATVSARDTALAAARDAFGRRHRPSPSPSPTAPSATPSAGSPSGTPTDPTTPGSGPTTPAPSGTASTSTPAPSTPMAGPSTSAPTAVPPTPTPTTPSPTTPSPTTASPTPTTPSPIPTQTAGAMPVGNLPGWTQVFADDFTTTAPLGSFLTTYGSRWGAYPSPWKDTSGNGVYNPQKTLSASGGVMDMWMHTEGGTHYVAAPTPKLPSMTYGRFSVRFQADSTPGYKAAWLLWPDSNVWPADGEIDFPEGDLDKNMSAFAHWATGSGGQDAFTLTATYAAWHVATVDWTPGKLVFYLDGKVVGTSTKMVPTKAMHWVMQTETTLNGTAPSSSVSGHVRVDWVTAYTYTP